MILRIVKKCVLFCSLNTWQSPDKCQSSNLKAILLDVVVISRNPDSWGCLSSTENLVRAECHSFGCLPCILNPDCSTFASRKTLMPLLSLILHVLKHSAKMKKSFVVRCIFILLIFGERVYWVVEHSIHNYLNFFMKMRFIFQVDYSFSIL